MPTVYFIKQERFSGPESGPTGELEPVPVCPMHRDKLNPGDPIKTFWSAQGWVKDVETTSKDPESRDITLRNGPCEVYCATCNLWLGFM